MVVQVLIDLVHVIVFVVVLIIVGFRLEDARGRKEAEPGVETFERVIRIGVELDEEHRRRRPQLHVAAQSAQVGDHRRFHVATVVHFDSVSARQATATRTVASTI